MTFDIGGWALEIRESGEVIYHDLDEGVGVNAEDICAELAAARAYITRGDYQAALDAIDQAVRLWSAERDYWALIERDMVRATTLAENARIREAAHSQTVRWVGRDGN